MSEDHFTPDQKGNNYRHLVILFILTSCMLFSGFISAYVVSMMDKFWVDFAMPNAFWWSTLILVASSGTIYLALKAAKQDKVQSAKMFVLITILLGCAFGASQWTAWKQLNASGIYFVGGISNAQGAYGTDYSAYLNGSEITFDGDSYSCAGKTLEENELSALTSFIDPLANYSMNAQSLKLEQIPGNTFRILHKQTGNFLSQASDGTWLLGDSALSNTDRGKLFYWAFSLKNGYGDLFLKGEYGKDYKLLFDFQPVKRVDRTFYIDGAPISAKQELDLLEAPNKTGQFLFVIACMHFLHIVLGLIILGVVMAKVMRKKVGSQNFRSIQYAGFFWHFLGCLWLFLFLFLEYIH